jgi:hypothetical protein
VIDLVRRLFNLRGEPQKLDGDAASGDPKGGDGSDRQA